MSFSDFLEYSFKFGKFSFIHIEKKKSHNEHKNRNVLSTYQFQIYTHLVRQVTDKCMELSLKPPANERKPTRTGYVVAPHLCAGHKLQ